MFLRRSSRLHLVVLASLLLVGCSFGSTSLPIVDCPDATGPLTGAVVFIKEQNLVSIQADGSGLTQLTTLPEHAGARHPLWSPDGTTLAFSLTSFKAIPTAEKGPEVTKQQLCGIDRQTGKGRTLFAGLPATERVEDASWSDDGTHMLLSLVRPGDPPLIMTLDLATGTLRETLRQAQSPALSPDGQRLAFIRYELSQEGIKPVLMLAQADGQQARASAVADPPFLYISTPRWSPDGRSLLFTASERRPEGRRTPDSGRALVDRLLGVSVAYAHEIPADLWMVDADGQNLRRVTTGLDDPRADWSPTGQELIYTNGFTGGVFVWDLKTQQRRQLAEKAGEGTVTWLKTTTP